MLCTSIRSYRDIPGVTEEEIAAIEALKAQRGSFSYGSGSSTEAFRTQDQRLMGFTPLFCKLLLDLFGIPFVPEVVNDWYHLINGVNEGTFKKVCG